jgi:signal transduction histidine kinase
MGALAGLVTHELSNPLNSIRLGLQVLADGAVPAVTRPVLDSLREEAARMGRTLEAFMGLGRGEGRERRRVGPELLERVRARTEAEAQSRRVRVRVRAAPDAPDVLGDPVVLEQALTNLVRNAVQASPEREAVDVTWDRAEDGSALIRVADKGPGFPAEGRERLIHLGASTRAAGHGLGLPLAHRFVNLHGGRVSLLDEPGGGARVDVRLPAAGPATGAGRG